jgi:hypothetical protein
MKIRKFMELVDRVGEYSVYVFDVDTNELLLERTRTKQYVASGLSEDRIYDMELAKKVIFSTDNMYGDRELIFYV